MCSGNVGVARKIDLESISEDIAALVRQLDDEVEGEIHIHQVKKIEEKLRKIIAE